MNEKETILMDKEFIKTIQTAIFEVQSKYNAYDQNRDQKSLDLLLHTLDETGNTLWSFVEIDL